MLTPFEARDRVDPWTTLAEEATFVPQLLAAHPARLKRRVWGQSVQGADMYTLSIGTGPINVLIVAQQHGSELAGRDAIFSRLRDWLETPAPDVTAYLQQVTLHLMPSAHPDNHTVRFNANNVDVGRNHIVITEPESQAIQRAIRTLDPTLVVDLHEGADITNDFASLPPLNGNTHPGILAVSTDLDTAIKDAIVASGHTWEPYRQARTVAPQNLCNSSGLQNRIALLCETERKYGDQTDVALRHDLMMLAIDTVLDWHSANLQLCEDTVAAARTTVRTDPLVLMDNESAVGPVVDPIPAGWLLTRGQHDELARHRNLLGLRTVPAGDGYAIPADQHLQAIGAYLADPESPFGVVSAQRVTPVPAPPSLRPIRRTAAKKFRQGGIDLEVVGVKMRVGDQVYDVEM